MHINTTPKLTIGMAVHDDFDGVYFTTQAIRLYHDARDIEIVVVDNNPSSSHGQATKRHVEHFCHVGTAGMQYIAMPESTGTTQPREEVFRRARGEWVMCMDSHVLLDPGSVAKLLAYCDAHPESGDLLQGPMLYDDLRAAASQIAVSFDDGLVCVGGSAIDPGLYDLKELRDLLREARHPLERAISGTSTHFEDEWRGEMWGTWGTDPRGLDPAGEPFEIFAQGLGLFVCRRDAWLGFHPEFRQFGGEECYLHTKFRQADRRCLCLPFLRWNHRFPRPGGRSYPATRQAKVRNYVLGHQELGLELDRCREHFLSVGMSAREFDRIASDPLGYRVQGEPPRPKESARDLFADLYRRHRSPAGDLLRKLSVGPDHVTVLGESPPVAAAVASARPRILEIYHGPDTDVSAIHATQQASPAFGGRMIQHLQTHVHDGELGRISQTDLLVVDRGYQLLARGQVHRVRGRIAVIGEPDDSWLAGDEWKRIHSADGLTVFSRIPGDEL